MLIAMRAEVIIGDITKVRADAIVNPANSSLLGGGGVDGAVHSAAGPGLLRECRRIRLERYPGGLPTGQAVITKAYGLPARYVIHTVGPIYGRDDLSLLSDCYTNSLRLADENGCASIAFPSISTGAYGVPVPKAARMAHSAISGYEPSVLSSATIVTHSAADYREYRQVFAPA